MGLFGRCLAINDSIKNAQIPDPRDLDKQGNIARRISELYNNNNRWKARSGNEQEDFVQDLIRKANVKRLTRGETKMLHKAKTNADAAKKKEKGEQIKRRKSVKEEEVESEVEQEQDQNDTNVGPKASISGRTKRGRVKQEWKTAKRKPPKPIIWPSGSNQDLLLQTLASDNEQAHELVG